MNDAAEPRGTISPKADFEPEWAVERLKKAMKGIGSDERMIIKILVSHDSLQREEIEQKYKNIYGRDLLEDLQAELGGHFENTVVAMLRSKYDILVEALYESFTMFGSDAEVLTEILCCRDADEIENLNSWYEMRYDETLEKAIMNYLHGDFRALMLSMANGARTEEEGESQPGMLKKDAEKLYDSGIGRNQGKDASGFIWVFNNRSYSQLKKIFEEYNNLASEPIEKSIKSVFSGDFRDGLAAIVKRVQDPYGFFSERLNGSMRGSGTDDKTLIRIIVTRSEEDLENIKQRYMAMYGNSLAGDVKSDTSGDYAKLLLAIINNTVSNNPKMSVIKHA